MNGVSNSDISAIILAAGFSSRMHQYKPLLNCGNKSMLETVIDLFKINHINDIIVVTGFNKNLLTPLITKNNAQPVFNADFESGMLSSIKTGIKNIKPDSAGFLLLPVDIPAIRPSTIGQIIQKFKNFKTNIIMPYFNDLSGHPPLIPCSLKTQILKLGINSSLRDLFVSQKNLILPLNILDHGILMDADDKKGYENIYNKIININIPDKKECLAIIDQYLPGQTEIQNHLKSVAQTAVKIAEAITDNVNKTLITAGALLHDIQRKKKKHALAGAELLAEMGFTEVSNIIAQHMDINLNIDAPINEKEIVYFADKIHNGENLDLNYEKRFKTNQKKFPHAKTNIIQRYENTKLIQARLEKSAGKSIGAILSE